MDFAASINQAPEAQAFLDRVAALPKQPGVSLDHVLKPSIEKEAELRRLFAQDRKNYHLLNPYVGLVSVFEAPEEAGIRLTRARIVKDQEDLSAMHVFPLPESRRRKDLEPCVVDSLEEFQRNWNIFTEGALSQLKDWNNVIAAGGSVLGCLSPLSPADKESRRTIRKFYHSSAYPTSDIDLFLWGLDAEQAEAKMNQIYEAVRDSVPWDVTCVRTKHAVSIHSQYPYRSVQIVLRLYQSPAEILAGFDVDTACVAYDGSRIIANPRSVVALMRQANTVDMTRRSPSYEVRLAKYASRGFEVYVPDLRRADVDPTIFERSLNRITGLARLLVLEKLSKPETRVSYLESRRDLRSRARNRTIYTRRMRRKRKGDLKAEQEIAGIDMNDYDVVQMHIPYGPGWTAQRIEKLVFQADMGINSTFNPKNKDRRLHRHVAFFGTMKECLEDLCEYCPEPRNDEEKALQEEEDKTYVRGRIAFIEDDPGRQSMTGSFNPIDIGEWSELAYLGPTERLFAAIAAQDRGAVQALVSSGEVDINRRDHVGRTALQVAALCSASDICMDLIDSGARMTARLADGRTALHVAAQMDLSAVIEKMIQRSAQNEEKAKEEEEAKAKAKEASDDEGKGGESDIDRPSSDDDWSSEEEEEGEKPKEKKDEPKNEPDADADIPEDNVDTPDILDVNLADWDFAFTPLDYAIASGSNASLQALLNGGADPKLVTKAKDYSSQLLHPLSLSILIADDAKAEEIIDQLIRAGATCAQADENLLSVLHCLVLSGRTRLVEKILRSDPSAVAALNVPHAGNDMVYPVVSAAAKHFYAIAILLLGYGAKVTITAEDRQKVKNMLSERRERYYWNDKKTPHELDYLIEINLPVETAMSYQSYLTSLFVKLGAQVSVPIKAYFERGRYSPDCRVSVLECVERQIVKLEKDVAEREKKSKPLDASPTVDTPWNAKTFAEARKLFKANVERIGKEKEEKDPNANKLSERKKLGDNKDLSDLRRALVYFKEMKELLKGVGAKTYSQIFADCPDAPSASEPLKPEPKEEEKQADRPQYFYISQRSWSRENVIPQLLDQYDALYEACWTGDNARIEELCLPRKSSKSDKTPLRITVISEDERHGGGYTPLSVAIVARKWDTARVILSIAKAQYKPKDETANKSAGMGNIFFDVDEGSDYNSTVCDSDEDYDEDEPLTGAVTDLAALASRDSAVQCDVSPKLFFEQRVPSRIDREAKKIIGSGTMAHQVSLDGDLEAFVNICDMLQQLPEPQEPDKSCLTGAILGDSPELLDEVIRRSGLGLDLSQLVVSDSSMQLAPNNSKLYLGLTVHGKKRKDLARYIEGGHSHSYDNDRDRIPLLWTAIQNDSKKVIDYLAGSGPLAAYQYYAKTKSTERAEAFRQLQDFDKQLPKLLGIVGNRRGENALIAAILSGRQENKLPMAKKILSLFPAQKYLQSTVAYYGWAATHLAAAANIEPSFFDFLFSNGLTAESTDNRGMNIYHFVCSLGHVELLKYFLGKFPNEVNSELLRQVTRESEETPFMTAVLHGKIKVVETLLQSGLSVMKECLTIRDAKGSMPLHAAVHKGYSKIAALLIKAGPESEALCSENGVGETVLETAWAKFLIDGIRDRHPGHNFFRYRGIRALDPSGTSHLSAAVQEDGHDLDTELELLKSVHANLLRDGKLAANIKLKDALDAFIPYFTEKVRSGTKVPDNPAEEETTDKSDYKKTFNVISAAVSAMPARRQLVHLTDVQRSVGASLAKAIKKPEPELGDEYSRRYRFLKGDEIPDEAEAVAWEKHEMWKGVLGWSWNLRQFASDNPNSHYTYF